MAFYMNNRKYVNDGKYTTMVAQFFCDTEADVAKLPDKKKVGLTSTAIVVETGNVYALMTDGWVVV